MQRYSLVTISPVHAGANVLHSGCATEGPVRLQGMCHKLQQQRLRPGATASKVRQRCILHASCCGAAAHRMLYIMQAIYQGF